MQDTEIRGPKAYDVARKAAADQWASDPANETALREVTADANETWSPFLGSLRARKNRDAAIVAECASRAGFPTYAQWTDTPPDAFYTTRLDLQPSRLGIVVRLEQDVDRPHHLLLDIRGGRGATLVSRTKKHAGFELTDPRAVRELGEALIGLAMTAERRGMFEPLRAFSRVMRGA